ncbi:hypothetical protein KKB40_03200 [Patescibacteria group bacterium]|nr:hypothetical protein [Patescibacteria group bacterium]
MSKRKKNEGLFGIYLLLIVSVILRLWKLGEIPKGLSLGEVRLGLNLSEYLGTRVLNPALIRLPFAILGIFSILLTFFLVKRLTDNIQLSYISAFLMAITPWHIGQSRIYSSGMAVFVLGLLIFLFLLRNTNFDLRKLVKFSIIIFILTFVYSIFSIAPDIKYKVDEQRNVASMSEFNFLSRAFSNKIIESYHSRRELLFENFDLGNYFFSGHPTERWGVEETPKLFVIFLPLILVGMLAVNKKTKKVEQLIISWSILSLSMFVWCIFRGPGETFLIVFPLVILAAMGLNHFLKKRRILSSITVIGILFELMIFCSYYFSGLNESQFSPRRPIFENLAKEVELNKNVGEQVLVSQKLIDPKPFFEFYIKNETLDDYEFRTFEIWKENVGKLFVDVLPDGALPSENLYTDDGSWPEKLEFVAKLYDTQKRQTVFVYRKNI